MGYEVNLLVEAQREFDQSKFPSSEHPTPEWRRGLTTRAILDLVGVSRSLAGGGRATVVGSVIPRLCVVSTRLINVHGLEPAQFATTERVPNEPASLRRIALGNGALERYVRANPESDYSKADEENRETLVGGAVGELIVAAESLAGFHNVESSELHAEYLKNAQH